MRGARRCSLTAATHDDISFFLQNRQQADEGAGSKKTASEIEEDMKVERHNIHLTCMMVLIELAGHEVHITQQGCDAVSSEAIRGYTVLMHFWRWRFPDV